MRAKQTGPAGTVKALGSPLPRAAAIAFMAWALAGCAGSAWVNPSKTPEDKKVDERICNKQAEEDALLMTGKQRADYGPPPGGPGPGTVGQSPMEMHDRDVVSRDFQASFADCMESKGYTNGKSDRD